MNKISFTNPTSLENWHDKMGKLSWWLFNYEDLLKKTLLESNSVFFFQVKFPFQYWIPQKNAIWIFSPWFRWHSDPNKDINLWVRVYSSKSVFSSCTFKSQQARWPNWTLIYYVTNCLSKILHLYIWCFN